MHPLSWGVGGHVRKRSEKSEEKEDVWFQQQLRAISLVKCTIRMPKLLDFLSEKSETYFLK